mmetsp:Transcript_44144/g.70935  ORF Transcript_44144/g.70935 Transcript_44144/m.70935 type:complete len:312 (+) Transcript_44144:1-936(+)
MVENPGIIIGMMVLGLGSSDMSLLTLGLGSSALRRLLALVLNRFVEHRFIEHRFLEFVLLPGEGSRRNVLLLRACLLHRTVAEDLLDINVDVSNVLLHQVSILLVLLVRLGRVAVLFEKNVFGCSHVVFHVRVGFEVLLERLLAECWLLLQNRGRGGARLLDELVDVAHVLGDKNRICLSLCLALGQMPVLLHPLQVNLVHVFLEQGVVLLVVIEFLLIHSRLFLLADALLRHDYRQTIVVDSAACRMASVGAHVGLLHVIKVRVHVTVGVLGAVRQILRHRLCLHLLHLRAEMVILGVAEDSFKLLLGSS